MKMLLTGMGLAVGIVSLSAQTPLPLLESGKTWSCYGDYFFLDVKYRLGADTVIGGETYAKVLARTDTVPFAFDAAPATYKSALREINGKVYVVEAGFSSPQLLYDFTKQAGDTLRFYRPIGNLNQGVLPNYVNGKVYKVDAVNVMGVTRRRWFIHDPQILAMVPPQAWSQLDVQADIWIEGLGGRTGLFSRMPQWGIVGPQPYLLACVEKDGTTLYQNNSGYTAHPNDPCFILPASNGSNGSGSGSGGSGTGGGGGSGSGSGGSGSGGNDSLITATGAALQAVLPQIFPNPNSGQFFIKPLQGETRVRIVKPDGTKVYEKRFVPDQPQVSFSLTGLESGLYFVDIDQHSGSRRLRMMVFKE
jgi:uncharacterized membrane protein YgcG